MTLIMTMALKSMCEPGRVMIKIMIMAPCELARLKEKENREQEKKIQSFT